MVTLRQRSAGVWEIRAYLGRGPNGKPVQVSKTVRGGKREAQRVAAELTLKPAKTPARITVAELLDLWVDERAETWAPQTLHNQRSRVEIVKRDPIAKIALLRLTAVDVDRWHARLARGGAGEGSIRNQHLVVRAAVTQAVRWGWLNTNVVAVAQLGRRKQAPRGALTDDDVRRVLAAAEELVDADELEPAAAIALRLAAASGIRRSELAALQWDDLRGDRLIVDSSIAIIRHGHGRTKTTPTLRDDATKTANRRTLTLDAATVEQLELLRKRFEELGPWLLAVGQRPVNPERIGVWWRRARGRAGVADRWRLHDLRHWSATTAINQGVPQHVIQRLLGHASPGMTAVYARLHDSTLREEMERYWKNRVDVEGRLLGFDPEAATADAEWLKHNLGRAADSLPNGYCGRPPRQECPHPNACLTCPDFQTTVQFLPVHRRQAEATKELVEAAEAAGRERLAANHRRVLANLDKIIPALEALEEGEIGDG